MVPPAPPRFSMTNCWPSMSPALAYKIRAVVSAPPAGAEARPANSVRRVSFPAIVASLIFAKNSTGARPRKATLSSPPDSPHIRGDGEASQKAAKNEKRPGATHARQGGAAQRTHDTGCTRRPAQSGHQQGHRGHGFGHRRFVIPGREQSERTRNPEANSEQASGFRVRPCGPSRNDR